MKAGTKKQGPLSSGVLEKQGPLSSGVLEKQGPLSSAPAHILRNNIRVKIELGLRRTKLEELAKTHGYTMTALIRYCIDCQLPELEARLRAQSPN